MASIAVIYIKAPVAYIIDPRMFCINNYAKRFCCHVPCIGSKTAVVWIKDCRGMRQRALSAFLVEDRVAQTYTRRAFIKPRNA